MKDFNFTLQIKGEENRIIGNIVQNDTANRFNIRLKDGVQVVELEDTDVITVTFKRNNDSVVIDSIGSDSVVVTDGVMGEIAVIPDEGAVINVGIVNVTVEVYDKAGKRKTSARFCYTVTPDFADSSTPEEDPRFPALQNLIAYLAKKNNEWEQAEAERAAGEQLRIENEEDRVAAEKARAEAESKRATEWMVLKQLAEKAISELVSPDITVKKNTRTEYVLHIKDKDGEFDTPNLKGQDGKGAGDMMMNTYDPDGDGVVSRSEISDNGVFTYTHNSNGLTGSGANGKFKCTVSGTVSTIKVNGASCSVKCGGENSMELVAGSWYSFILDGTTVNFRGGGGGLTDSKLAQATATADKVLAPYTFYSGDKTIKTGTMPTHMQNQAGSVYDSGQQGALFFRNIPEGYYAGGGAQYPYRPEIYAAYADVAAAIGLTADKIVEGQQVLGITGNASSSELNFTVVGGTTRPANPANNTIWINTSTAISRWSFKSTAVPTYTMENGYVHIVSAMTNDTGHTLNALKTNGIHILISGVYQRENDVWNKKEAYIYQDGEWKSFLKIPLYIYNEGASDTGISAISLVNGYKNEDSVYNGTTCRELATHINVGCTQAIRTTEKLNVTGYTKIKALVAGFEGYGDADKGVPNVTIFVTDSPNQTLNNEDPAYNAMAGSYRRNQTFDPWTQLEYNIEDISGEYYVGIGNGNFTTGASQLYVKAIWLE